MTKVSRLAVLGRTLPRLGLHNVARVALYNARLAVGLRPTPPPQPYPLGPIFNLAREKQAPRVSEPVELTLFGWMPHRFERVPDWHADPLDSMSRVDPTLEWPEAMKMLNGRDAKLFWELSRFYWVPHWAYAAHNGDQAAIVRLETWIADWVVSNPPYRGINWACGQEAGLRLLNLAQAAMILEKAGNTSVALRWIIDSHARRIRPTIAYALAQDNNHGSTEAVALYVAGHWLGQSVGAHMAKLGRRLLQERVLRLIQADGSPCQYSLTYHRVVLETFCLAELWRRHVGDAPFATTVISRLTEGARWLYQMIAPSGGDVPNLGANDGSHPFTVVPMPYRDFRPTVALAARLFDNAALPDLPNRIDPRLRLFDLPAPTRTWSKAKAETHDVGGYHVLSRDKARATLRFPRFRFRPSQADALHLDLWLGEHNILRDAGTGSYVSAEGLALSGTAAHNTICFDGRDQMPRLGPFLYGDWLKAEAVESVHDDGDAVTAAAAYADRLGARHHRKVKLNASGLTCTDTLSGDFREACLRWRLAPGTYRFEGDALTGEGLSIEIRSDGPPLTMRLTEGVESRHYLEFTPLTILEVEIPAPGTITTSIRF